MDLKYNLNLYISKVDRSITIKEICQMLKQAYGISKSTFFKDRFIAKNSKESIPSDRLDIYAHFFEVNVTLLKNYEITGPSLKEMQQENKTNKK